MHTIYCSLVIIAGIFTAAHAGWGKPPLWVAIVFLCIAALLTCLPLR